MKKIVLIVAICSLITPLHSQTKESPVDHVNMMIGTDGKHRTEYGGTNPAIGSPFAMTQWCAVTRLNGISRTMYHSADTTLLGFMATHQPCVWMGDYGYFTLMPQLNRLRISPSERAASFDRTKERSTPYYYSVVQNEPNGKIVRTEMTATSRASIFRIHYPESGVPLLYLEAGRENEGGEIVLYPDKQEIHIINAEHHDRHLGPRLYNLRGYYVLKFNRPFKQYGTWKNSVASAHAIAERGSNVGGYLEFEKGTKEIEIRIGSSFISLDQAADNLTREIPEQNNFETVSSNVKKQWNDLLGKATIKGASADDLAVFYTAFFRTLQFPKEFSEYGRYYSAFDDTIHEGVSYNTFSLWDTFRAQHPWMQLVVPERVNDMMQSLVQMYKEGGWLPKWPNPTYTNIMIGTHADAVIADAYVNGFRDFDLKTAYEAIRKNAFTPPTNDHQYRWGDRHFWNGHYEGRGGLSHYIEKGYVASDYTNESVARTLEFALDDYCVAQMAKGLGHEEDYRVLMRRTKNYRNLYDAEGGFFRARRSDGSWDGANEGFTEGANWTYLFCVMQDARGLIDLMGGKEKFIAMLDRNFNDGHYRHDNEPGHHYVYMYNYCDRPDLAQQRIPQIIDANYQNHPDGLTGNDDCGQMSAWYLFSSLGFYPFLSASGEYALGIPRFEEATLSLPNGKTLKVTKKDRKNNRPLTRVTFNGKQLDKPFIRIADLLRGGELVFSN